VFLGSIVGSETTTANIGAVGVVRRDPFAMLPFCGYHMGDYLAHWIKIGQKTSAEKLPKIFYVNWFRKSDDGKWLWPAMATTAACSNGSLREQRTRESGKNPHRVSAFPDAIDTKGISVTSSEMADLLKVDVLEWKKELEGIREHYKRFGSRLPSALNDELRPLKNGSASCC